MNPSLTKTNFLQWIQSIGIFSKQPSSPMVTILYGENDYLKYKTKILIKQKSTLTVSSLSSKLEEDDIRSLTESLSLFEEKNLYIIEEKDHSNFVDIVSIILSSTELSNRFLLILDKSDKKIETLVKKSVLDIFTIGCPTLWEKDILNYIDFSLKEYGINISHQSKIYIFTSLGTTLSLIDNEIKKLSMLYGSGSLPINISDNDIKKSVSVLKKDYTFKLKDMLLKKDFSSILILLEDLIQRGESSLAILGFICKHIRIFYNIKLMKEKNVSNINSYLKLNPYVFKEYMQSEKYYSKDLCLKILKQSSRIDSLIKTSNVDDTTLLSKLIYMMIDQ